MPGFAIPVEPCKGGPDVGKSGPVHTMETARRHRYLLETLEPLSQDGGILLQLFKCSRPTVEIDAIPFHNSQDEIFRPGKQHWKAIEFSFYESVTIGDDNSPGTNLTSKLIREWWASTMINTRTSFHNPPSTYLKNAQLDMLNGAGRAIWSYHIYDSWPAKVSPQDLGYADNEISEVSVTLYYSKCLEN